MDDAWRKAQREAADWLILRREEPEDGLLGQRFEDWLDADPLHVRAWASVAGVFEVLEDAMPPSDVAWRSVPWRQAPSFRRPRASWRAGIALAAAACIALAIAPSLWLRLRADAMTGVGEVRTLRLADGSRVSLGPGSAIAYANDGEGRTVRLLAGQAWFAVKHDPATPFRVIAGDVATTDIGTAFDVRRIGGATSIAVGEGRVRVVDLGTAPATARDLGAGQWLRIAADHGLREGIEAPGIVGAWRDGTLVIRNRTIAEAIDELRPWYAGRIILMNAAFGRQRIDGVYDPRRPEAALEALVHARGGVVRRITPWVMLVSGG